MQSFSEIDALRRAHGLTRKQVYDRADLHKETWRRLDRGAHKPNTATLEKLSDAVTALIEEKGQGHAGAV